MKVSDDGAWVWDGSTWQPNSEGWVQTEPEPVVTAPPQPVTESDDEPVQTDIS